MCLLFLLRLFPDFDSVKMEARKVCLFCKLDEDNELLYGKIYELDGDIVAHYFCLVSLFFGGRIATF